MPRRAASAQVLGVSPWRRGGRPVPLGTDAGRAATAARCSRTTSGERAPEERPAGRPAIIFILSAWRACVLACPAHSHASRVCAFRVPACSARLHASRLCASGAPARTFTWRASRASHLAHSVRTDATHCVRPDASCCVRSVYKVGQFRAQSQRRSTSAAGDSALRNPVICGPTHSTQIRRRGLRRICSHPIGKSQPPRMSARNVGGFARVR